MPARLARRRGALVLVAAVVGLAIIGAIRWLSFHKDVRREPATGSVVPAAHYVGSTACATCHAAEHGAWTHSQHAVAMQPATEATVLGDFADARFTYVGTTSTFFRRDGRFMVNTDGPDGRLRDFEIKYTFGVAPLQQYLVELPGGRVQALSIVWDARPKADGGQRWYHLYPKERITHRDPLHWTRGSQNWNFMCAECHSTEVRRRYDAGQDRYATTWSEISVGCEGCHGAGSEHVKLAQSSGAGKRIPAPAAGFPVAFDERKGVNWSIDTASGNAKRNAPRTSSKEIETCALCHARRAPIREGPVPGQSLADTHLPSLLTEGLYEVDGQMRDEVYNYGSFLQSRMHARGVTCSDCHDPHSGKLRTPGNGVCYQCHATDKYDAEAHHRHPRAAQAQACTACHMPVRNYMVIDARHDHSFRVPRPDMSVALGTPNACNDCHRDRAPGWAADAIARWHGEQRKGFQTFGPALHAARTDAIDARRRLLDVARDAGQPAIARATALAELAPYLTAADVHDVAIMLNDADLLVRIGALQALRAAAADDRWRYAQRMLGDPVLGVRLEAVSLLLETWPQLDPSRRKILAPGIDEYTAVQNGNADRSESQVNLGSLYALQGDPVRAEAAFRRAIVLEPAFVPGYVNLSNLFREQGRDADAESVLQQGLAAQPDSAALHHALGLALVRTGKTQPALRSLERAATLAPGDARYAYVHAVARASSGERGRALALLADNHRRHPSDRDTLVALATFARDAGDRKAAIGWAQRLEALTPYDPQAASLLRELGGVPPAR
jgi:predicted CXXCH cytochrome family protein